jgi:alpha-glucosidase
MPWSAAAPHGGFSSAQPWLKLPAAHLALAVDAQEQDEAALLHDWRRFLAFRRAHPAMISGALRMLDLPEPLIGFVRENDVEQIDFVFNLSAKHVEAGTAFVMEPYGVSVLVKSLIQAKE